MTEWGERTNTHGSYVWVYKANYGSATYDYYICKPVGACEWNIISRKSFAIDLWDEGNSEHFSGPFPTLDAAKLAWLVLFGSKP